MTFMNHTIQPHPPTMIPITPWLRAHGASETQRPSDPTRPYQPTPWCLPPSISERGEGTDVGCNCYDAGKVGKGKGAPADVAVG